MAAEWVGGLAGFLTTIAFLPQVVKIWTTKSAEDISAVTFSVFVAGLVLWLVYGLMLQALPIILANIFTLLLAATVLVLKFCYRRREAA